ncbi:dicarboxylate/amino acid:cation symporter [Paraburkholderia xenovorans]|uniref:dicarboxylate/amino acid:cation symporter n=1 Tax=Paraburkholderia xenovorans TaxID=36873 RepID=UPI0038BA3BD0
MRRHRLSHFILIALVLGILVGTIAHSALPAGPENEEVAGYLGVLAEIFLRLIKMIIAPLVFAGIVSGMVSSDSPAEVGRIGARSLIWFLAASIFSLVLGLVLANLYGIGNSVLIPRSSGGAEINTAAFSLKNLITHIVPQSAVLAMSQNDIIAILVFALFFGFALSAICKTEPMAMTLAQALEGVFKVMLRVTRYVMYFAPVGVFAAVASAVTLQGIGVLTIYGKFIGGVYSGLILLSVFLVAAGFAALGRPVFRLLGLIREPMLVGFSTSSSEAAFPKMIEQLEKFGVPGKVSTFVLPLAYSFNADGLMMYQAFATVFLLQAYHIHVSFMQQLGMLFVMLIASKGAAGVPRASLVVVAATLPTFGIPIEGVAFLLAADTFIDMGRTVVNLVGNGIAAAVVSKWEMKRARADSKPAARDALGIAATAIPQRDGNGSHL